MIGININEELKQVEIENIIWIIYLFIIGAQFISNYFVEKYLYTFDPQIKTIFRYINIAILSIALLIYIYFVYLSVKNVKKDTKSIYKNLLLIASILILVGGVIYLYVEIYKNTNPEISIV